MRRGEQKETRNGSVEQEIDVRPSGVAQPQQIGGCLSPIIRTISCFLLLGGRKFLRVGRRCGQRLRRVPGWLAAGIVIYGCVEHRE